jgi:hypothetical protein
LIRSGVVHFEVTGDTGELQIRLDAYEGKSLRIVGPPPPGI